MDQNNDDRSRLDRALKGGSDRQSQPDGWLPTNPDSDRHWMSEHNYDRASGRMPESENVFERLGHRIEEGFHRATREVGKYVGHGPKGWRRSDERIKEDVCERLTAHGEIDASDIEVVVAEAEVTLSGTVGDRRTKRMAEDVADRVSGVKDVHNQIKLRAADLDASRGRQGSVQSTEDGLH